MVTVRLTGGARGWRGGLAWRVRWDRDRDRAFGGPGGTRGSGGSSVGQGVPRGGGFGGTWGSPVGQAVPGGGVAWAAGGPRMGQEFREGALGNLGVPCGAGGPIWGFWGSRGLPGKQRHREAPPPHPLPQGWGVPRVGTGPVGAHQRPAGPGGAGVAVGSC